MKRILTLAFLVAACGSSGPSVRTRPASPEAVSTSAGATAVDAQTSPSAIGGASPACDAAASTARGDGVLVSHPADGFSVTLPRPWAEIDVATGRPTDEFANATVPAAWGGSLSDLATAAGATSNLRLLAVDLSADTPVSDGHPLLEDLSVRVVPGDGDPGPLSASTLMSIAKAGGVQSGIDTAKARIDGQEGAVVRWPAKQRFPDGTIVDAAVSIYGVLREGKAFLLLFDGPSGSSTASADAIAASFTVGGPSSDPSGSPKSACPGDSASGRR